MLTVKCDLIGISDLMFGRHVCELKRDDETYDQYDARTWREKVHVDKDGHLFLQPFALKNCLESAAKWLSLHIPGEGKKTFTKRFVSGILVAGKLLLANAEGRSLTLADVDAMSLFVPSDGKRGSGRRVSRIFPTIHEWRTTAEILIYDSMISGDVFSRHIVTAGRFVGFGAMRAENGGINGRFGVENLVASEMKV